LAIEKIDELPLPKAANTAAGILIKCCLDQSSLLILEVNDAVFDCLGDEDAVNSD
jgi:hypothetical protein